MGSNWLWCMDYMEKRRKVMIKEIIKWIKDVANSCCNESVKTASTICDGTRKANAEFVKAFMSNFK